MIHPRTWALVFFAFTLIVSLSSPAISYSGGATAAHAREGCGGCHGPASADVRASIKGMPAEAKPGARYDLSLSIEGGPPTVVERPQGGLAVVVTDGRLEAGSGARVLGDVFLTHSEAGNRQRAWTFTWTAPDKPGSNTTVWFAFNAVNGDTQHFGGQDKWNKGINHVRLLDGSPASNPPGSDPSARAMPTVGAVVAIVALCLLARIRKKA